jgi:hypothetical protein
MDTNELSEAVADIVHDARCRVGPGSIGEQQYTTEPEQLFESMELANLFTYAEEELLDCINYCVMLIIRIRRLRDPLTK